jgi:O-methyltransferase involved in polyketide biosynthesis
MNFNTNINNISQTAFLTLQCHAKDARSKNPILNDRGSINTIEKLKESFGETGSAFFKRLADNKVQNTLVVHTALRARQYDKYIRSFIDKFPDAAVVNIGCGLDDRFSRVDNGKITFYDLDLPDIIDIKKQLFSPSDRYFQISQSVFEFDWMERVTSEQVILVAEGVFMYCEEEDVRALFKNLKNQYNKAEIVFEIYNSKWLKGWRRRSMEVKMKKQLKLGDDALFKFGIPDSDEIEKWDPDYHLLEDWSYFDVIDNWFLKLFGKIESLRKVQWTVRYELG